MGVPFAESDDFAGLPAVGALVDERYLVERYIGRGSMALVAAARRIDRDEPVALKLLRPELTTSSEAMDRFVREARACAVLDSPHIARVIDVGRDADGFPYMVMELLAGQDLWTTLRQRGELSVERAVDTLLQAARAIATAHAGGIVHRDLKPSNLFSAQQPDGTTMIKVLDFGIAKTLDAFAKTEAAAKLTATGAVLGSPGYWSPEQIRDAKSVDERTDIWGLGATLYALLTAMAPFEAASLMTLCARVLSEPHRPVSMLRRDVPEGLSQLIDRCLEKRSEDRFADVAELLQALEPFAAAHG